jgi:hypothetical protein
MVELRLPFALLQTIFTRTFCKKYFRRPNLLH